jgi:hypothetical protein
MASGEAHDEMIGNNDAFGCENVNPTDDDISKMETLKTIVLMCDTSSNPKWDSIGYPTPKLFYLVIDDGEGNQMKIPFSLTTIKNLKKKGNVFYPKYAFTLGGEKYYMDVNFYRGYNGRILNKIKYKDVFLVCDVPVKIKIKSEAVGKSLKVSCEIPDFEFKGFFTVRIVVDNRKMIKVGEFERYSKTKREEGRRQYFSILGKKRNLEVCQNSGDSSDEEEADEEDDRFTKKQRVILEELSADKKEIFEGIVKR